MTTTRPVRTVPTQTVRADEVRMTDTVWFENWDGTMQRGRVDQVRWDGEDVEVTFTNRVWGDVVTFSTSPSNGVTVTMR